MAGDAVDHPQHYNELPNDIECIDVVRHFNFNRGNAIKYIWRAGLKGDEVEDLKKAIWYLNDEIKRVQTADVTDTTPVKQWEARRYECGCTEEKRGAVWRPVLLCRAHINGRPK